MTNIIKYEEHQKKFNAFRELAANAVKSGCYANMSVEKAVNLMLSAADLGVSPMKALNGAFHIIHGKIMMAGHLISDRIRSAGHSVKVIEHTREKCVMIGVRKDNGDSYKSEFDMEDAKIAGLLKSDAWIKYPKDMLYNRAIARLGRILFSDVVGACYSEDEGDDIANVKPQERVAKDPDHEITINVLETAKIPEKLTEQQCAIIDSLIQGNEAAENGIKSKFKLNSIYDISPDKYEPLVQWLQSLQEQKDEVVNG